MERERQVSQEDEVKLLRRKAYKLEGELAQMARFLEEEQERFRQLKRENLRLAELSMFSPICPNLYNKRFFDQEAPRLLEMERRFGNGKGCYYGVVYADLNHLARVNAEYGHDGGNRAICSIGKTLMQTVRRSDLAIHIHGDEFVVLFFASSWRECYKTYARISRALRRVPVTFHDGLIDHVSAMTALAMQKIDDDISLADVCHKADMRMLRKKEVRDKGEEKKP
ncbi:GGDEF domain-containing protein [Candidatus Falkowbacteria bacterium]|nr:GGDEF domain-containing protein [Candidatus Falkowbacteria bacterium]